MKKLFEDYWYIFYGLLFVVGIAFAAWETYMFWWAPCEKIKEFWYLVTVPGRCL